jgi:hypothetical protein
MLATTSQLFVIRRVNYRSASRDRTLSGTDQRIDEDTPSSELPFPPNLQLRGKLHPRHHFSRSSSCKSPNKGRIPHIQHLDIARIIWMHAVAQIAPSIEAGVLIHDPDRRRGAVQALCPGHNGRVELLDFGVEVADGYGYNLGDLSV